jgi:hypothetical protein
MHCPRCGQQQVSEQIKFCSRCGFLLELIPEILANGGILPQLAQLNQNKKWLTRKNGLKVGFIWLMFMWFVVAPIGGIADSEELAALGGVLGFAGFILSLIISFMFLENPPKFANMQNVNFRSDYMPQNLSGNIPSQGALPPQQSAPASSYVPPAPGRWQTTNDLTAPPSVTEPTTKLLEKDK